MLVILKFLLLFIFFNIKLIFASEECKTESNLNIGLIENKYIDYRYYLYYELSNFSKERNIEFDISFVENNPEDYDIIFGEWDVLSKFSLYKTSLPHQIREFYEDNSIEVNQNILPLDLDTYIVLHDKKYSLKNLDELSNYSSPIKYTLGMNFNNNDELLKLLLFSSHRNLNEFDSHTLESTLSSFKKLFKNSNKNVLNSNFLDMYNSFESKESLFTLFNDGVLLYKNLQDTNYNIFPQNRYIWDEDQGLFKNHSDHIPYSFYGFSAYINNINQIGLLCHFIKDDVRDNAFKNFNIQISPLSIKELNNFKTLPEGYVELVKMKNKNIVFINEKSHNKFINIVNDIIVGKKNYKDLIESNKYLN